jgi:gliding motility-associated-like protein
MIGLINVLIFKDFKDEYKEYIELKLKLPLVKDKFYCGEFYAFNRNIAGDQVDTNTDVLESNNLSMAFSDTLVFYPVSSNSRDNLVSPSSVKIREMSVVPADNSWHRIEGCFIADKNYEYLIIGNFHRVDSTLINRKTFGNDFASAYYFIDDVALIEMPYNPPDLSENVTFCHNQDQIILNATADGATSYTWQDGTTGPEYIVSKKVTSSYTVNIAYNEFTYRHTFRVVYVPDIDLGPDTLLCNGEVLTLRVNHPLKEFIWSDNSTDPIKTIDSEGTYWIEVLSDCPIHDTIQVSFIDCPGLVPNVFTPNGDGYNDNFFIQNIENRDWSLQVFNRWGKKVYENRSYKNDWDGADLSSGVYYYLLQSNSLNKKLKGWVQLIK